MSHVKKKLTCISEKSSKQPNTKHTNLQITINRKIMTNTEHTNLDGTPDMRFKVNKKAEFDHIKAQFLLMESKVVELTKLGDMVREKRLTEKPVKVKPATCCICMEESAMQKGQAKLDCGHTYCISCFTQHARISNKCPLCRDSFAPEPKKAAVQENSSFDRTLQ